MADNMHYPSGQDELGMSERQELTLNAAMLIDHIASHLAFAKAHMSNAENAFEQLKRTVGR